MSARKCEQTNRVYSNVAQATATTTGIHFNSSCQEFSVLTSFTSHFIVEFYQVQIKLSIDEAV